MDREHDLTSRLGELAAALAARQAAQEGELAALRAQVAGLGARQPRRGRQLGGRLLRAGLVAGLLALLLSSSASASIPSTATGAIDSCYRTAGSLNLLYVLDTAVQASCPGGMTQTSINQNPAQVALLRWYGANQVGGTGTTFSVGNFPNGVAFDGANIWVTNDTSPGTVTKLRASDGSCNGSADLSACTYSVGTGPHGVAFDGANIWVANYSSGTVSKLRASDGTVLGTYSVRSFPFGVAFDGANIWVTNLGSGTVSKL